MDVTASFFSDPDTPDRTPNGHTHPLAAPETQPVTPLSPDSPGAQSWAQVSGGASDDEEIQRAFDMLPDPGIPTGVVSPELPSSCFIGKDATIDEIAAMTKTVNDMYANDRLEPMGNMFLVENVRRFHVGTKANFERVMRLLNVDPSLIKARTFVRVGRFSVLACGVESKEILERILMQYKPCVLPAVGEAARSGGREVHLSRYGAVRP
jgi:hypothetical protein